MYCLLHNLHTSFFFYLFTYDYFLLLLFFACVRSQLRHVGSSIAVLRPLVVVRGLLASCAAQVPWRLGSVAVVHGFQGAWALQFAAHGLQLRHASSVVLARGLSCPTACGILVSRPGIEPASPAFIARRILYHWTSREVPPHFFCSKTFEQFH